MKKTMAFISALLVAAAAFSLTACGDKESSSSNPYADVDIDASLRKEIRTNVTNSELLEDTELENKTIK